VAKAQNNLTASAKLNPRKFQEEHSAISLKIPKRVTSLGKNGGPISIHWQDGPDAKVLIRNIDRLDGAVGTENITETVLAHIERFQQDGLSFPREIYLDTRKVKVSQRNLNDFATKLVKGINELNKTDYDISSREVSDGEYIRLDLDRIDELDPQDNLDDLDKMESMIKRRTENSGAKRNVVNNPKGVLSKSKKKQPKLSDSELEDDPTLSGSELEHDRERSDIELEDDPIIPKLSTKNNEKKKKNQPERLDDELDNDLIVTKLSTKNNEKKRTREDRGDSPTIDTPSPKRRKELVDKKMIENNIRRVFKAVGNKLNYKYTAGDQGAETTIKVKDQEFVKSTYNNIHAEMGVLNDALEKDGDGDPLLTITEEGRIVVKDGNRALKPVEFKTAKVNDPATVMDHCGYCTFFLTLMNVPTGRPTFMPSRNSGAQGKYPLPVNIREHPAILARALGFDDATQFVNEVKEGIEGYYEASRGNRRLSNLSGMEKIVKDLSEQQKNEFDTWKSNDDENGDAGERFHSLLDDVFGHKKADLLDSFWDPLITSLTTIMKQKEPVRKAFLKSTK